MQSKNASQSRHSLALTNFSASPPLAAAHSSKSVRSSFATTTAHLSSEEEEGDHRPGDLSAISALPSSPSDSEDNDPLPEIEPSKTKGKGKEVERSPSPPELDNEQLMQELDVFDNDYAGPEEEQEEEQGVEQANGELEPILEEEEDEQVVLSAGKENVVAGKKGKAKGKEKAATVSPSSKKPASKKRKWDSVEPEGIPISSLVDQCSLSNSGVRKSSRRKIEPLEYWRNERIVYARRDSGPQPHYGIKDVLRPEKPRTKSLVSKKRSASATARSKSVKEEDEDAIGGNFEGWDDATDPEGLVWDYVKHEETRRSAFSSFLSPTRHLTILVCLGIAFTSKMIATKTAGKQNFRFQKIFTDGDFMAGGILEIPVNEKKPLKPARDNSYVRESFHPISLDSRVGQILFVVKGAVRALVYRTTFTIAKGGFFLVPRGMSTLSTSVS